MRLTRGGRVCDTPCVGCGLRAQWLRRLSAAVDAVVAPARFVLERHLELGFFPRARTAIVRWGVPTLPDLPPLDTPRRPIRFLFMGQLRANKGVRVLLDAWAHLGDVDARLEIAGAGDLAEECRVASGPRLTFHGFASDDRKRDLYRACQVAVLPAIWWEVAPLAVTEAIASGLPVIASRIGGLPELVEDGATGFLVEPRNAIALAERIRAMAGDPALVRAMSERCRAKARELRFDRTVDGLVDAYESVLRGTA
jgi:glycosyltransferase involved in cell wall biosynthesis